MQDINKIILIGGLGRDPELKIFEGQRVLLKFSVATKRKWRLENPSESPNEMASAGQLLESESKLQADGQWATETDWHDVVVWGRLAEICKQYLKKGSRVYVEGEYRTKKYIGQDGKQKYSKSITASRVSFLSFPRKSGEVVTDEGSDGAPLEVESDLEMAGEEVISQ